MKIADILSGTKQRKKRGLRVSRLKGNSLFNKKTKNKLLKKYVKEGGNVFPGTTDFPHEKIPDIMKTINSVLTKTNSTAIPIGSGATPTPGKVSGDLDMIVDVDQLKQHFNMEDAKDADIRKKLRQVFDLAGFNTGQSGTSVHVEVKSGDATHQVDIMVVPNAANAAQFHTHSIPKGSPFKGTNKHQLLSIIAREKGMLWSNYVGLFKRLPNGKKDPNGFITSDINEIAKLLLGPNARKEDMGSVESIVAALGKEGEQLLANIRANDPNWKEQG